MATTGHESELVSVLGLKAALQSYKTSISDNKLNSSLKGAVNGLAELDSNGKVPAAQLPSYVDDVIEGYFYNDKFYQESTHTTLITGEGGKIYTDLATNKTYRWGGSAYSQIKGDLVIGTATGNAADGKVVNDHTSNTTVHITAAERTAWNAKGSYSKPSGGIPLTHLASGVQTSLGLADTALQSHQDISGKADKSATVSTITYNTTDKKITKTINGSTTDVVTAAKIVTDGGGITSHLDISGKADKATTLAGYGITDAKIANGVITLGTASITPLTSHQNISGKADKSATVSTVAYDTTNKKITKTINGTTTDVVTAALIVTDGGGLTSHQDISGKQDKVAKLGSTTKPVYTSAAGTFALCSTYAGGTKVTLNGTAKGASDASFYAPTDAGTAGQVLIAGGTNTAPSWLTVATTTTCTAIISELT